MTRTVRALLAYGVERFDAAGLSYGTARRTALDEAAWLILHSLGFPLDELNPISTSPSPTRSTAPPRRSSACAFARASLPLT